MSSMADLFSVVCCFVLSLYFSTVRCDEPGVRIETQVGKTFDALCPSKHYVASVTITRETGNGNRTDFRFSIQCQPLAGDVISDVGEETCTVLLPIPLLYYDLSFDDYEYNCACNEYLVGIRSDHFGRAWDGAAKGPERRIQLICCRSNGVYVNNGECGYTGMESLLGSPWKESEVGPGRLNGKAKQAVIQGLILNDNYVNSRVCAVEALSVGKAVDDGECYEYVGCSDAGTNHVGHSISRRFTSNPQVCYSRSNEPFGWSETLSYVGGSGSVASYRSNQWYQKQEYVCRNGHRLSSINLSRRKPEGSSSKDVDYILTAACASNGAAYPCFCYWMDNCPSKGADGFGFLDGAWYASGVRSWWNAGQKRRKIELLCCHSNGLKIGDCSSRSLSGSQSNFRLEQAADSTDDDQDISVVANIESSYSGDSLSLKVNVCTARLTFEWCTDDYDAQCRRCRRKKRSSRNQRQLPEANGAVSSNSQNGNGNSNTNGATHNGFFFTDRGSSGWGPLWYPRPTYHRASSGSSSSSASSGSISAPPACSFTPKCGQSCPSSVKLPTHGHGGRGNGNGHAGSSGPIGPAGGHSGSNSAVQNAVHSSANSVTNTANQNSAVSSSLAQNTQGVRSITEYHAGQGRGNLPVGPKLQQGTNINTNFVGNQGNFGSVSSMGSAVQAAHHMTGGTSQMGNIVGAAAPAAHVAASVAHVAPAVAHVAPAAAHAAHGASAGLGAISHFGKK